MSEIKVGSVVFHRGAVGFRGPGTVVRIEHDKNLGIDIYSVFWQSDCAELDHTARSLMTMAEKEFKNGSVQSW